MKNFFLPYKEVKSLRQVSFSVLEEFRQEIGETSFKRCQYVLEENERVRQTEEAFRDGNLKALGELMYASHRSLSEDYEVSSKELDILVNLAAEAEVEGARMTGAGFGGCTVNLVKKGKVDKFVADIKEKYRENTGIEAEVYVSNPGDGARKF